jgi:hypothetical protein
MTTPEYGGVTIIRLDDGTVTVTQADDVIGMAQVLLNHMAAEVDGVLTLDTAGEYRYRRVGPSVSDPTIIVFERIYDTPPVTT